MSFFYDLNKKLDSIRAIPEVTHGQLNEGAHTQHAMDLNPSMAKPPKQGMLNKIGTGIKKAAGAITGPGDEELLQRLERETGGRRPARTPIAKEALSPAKQKSFAALAPPKDKITFADKIAGAKKEVDEMLGDVAAEAMKKALGGGRGRNQEMEEATKDIPGGRRHTAEPGGYGRKDDENEKGRKVARVGQKRSDQDLVAPLHHPAAIRWFDLWRL